MYTCVEREHTKSLRIRRGYKSTKSVSREGGLILVILRAREKKRGKRKRTEQVMRDEGNKISMKRASLAGGETVHETVKECGYSVMARQREKNGKRNVGDMEQV